MAAADEIQKITETLYQHNLELSVKNQTLVLLKKLYEKGISILTPEGLAEEITKTIREDLNLEFASIFLFEQEADSLFPLAFSKSDRLLEIFNKLGFMLKDIKIGDVKKRNFFEPVVYQGKYNMTNNIEEVWGGIISPENLEEIKKESHVKTILVYPLLTGSKVLGLLLFGLNRDYNTLNTFEKESIKSFIDVIALSLDKVYLYKELQDANENLKNLVTQRESLVHLVTHKVKGSFTHSKYIFASILDGTFKEISEVKVWAAKGFESDNTGIATVDLVLNAANLQKGNVKYDMKKIDLKALILKTIEDKKGPATAKGLSMEVGIKDGDYNIMGDEFWLQEAIHNLIENSIRYTKTGKIWVGLEKNNGKILFSVKDTGIGLTPEDKAILFTEGGRGKDSIKVNVDSTGYGLFTIKLVIEAHKGRVWAESEGGGKGSQFYIELNPADAA